MKIIVAGSRGITDKEIVYKRLRGMLKAYPDMEIVSGCAKGPDSIAIEFANEFNIVCHKFPANWDLYGKRAGYLRNEEMAKFSEGLIVFWDEVSRGTRHMIELGVKHKLKIKVINKNGEVIKIDRKTFVKG